MPVAPFAPSSFLEHWSQLLATSMSAHEGAASAPEKVPVPGQCAECGAEDLCEYPILGADGWYIAVKCQRCLGSQSRVPWNRLGWVSLPEDAL